VTLAVATPPRPEQEIEYVDVTPRRTTWDPDGPSEPNHAPDAVQEVARVDTQVSVMSRPGGIGSPTSVSELVSVTVGATGGGDDPPPQAAIANATTAVMTTVRNCDRMARPPGCGRSRSTYNTSRLGLDPS